MDYKPSEIEAYWQKYWAESHTFEAENQSHKPKYYVLDMFPYPSGAGLHVGHPLGYIASDIYARFKRHEGFNVLHPMGYDSFGLPAEQFAIETGQHPAQTTEANIKRYREQLDKIGFSFDWSREVRTSDPTYYKWTQWIFSLLFDAYYNVQTDKAERIDKLTHYFAQNGSHNCQAFGTEELNFSAAEWLAFSPQQKNKVLMNYRLAYQSLTTVNWCEKLGTVLANDEVRDGVSERGGHPVERKLMKQWSLRITAYADRLLEGLNRIDWPENIKEVQRNWIGKSKGCSIHFQVLGKETEPIEVFTTRPDTLFGVSFVTLAPEHPLVPKITTDANLEAVNYYVTNAKNRSERERMSDTKKVSGVFTGAYCKHPLNEKPIPIWVGDYVLAGYGTGAVMAVPAGDQRDWFFATHFGIEIPELFEQHDVATGALEDKSAILKNSEFLNGMKASDAIVYMIEYLEKHKLGVGKKNYRLRDAGFSRQRYWGEPFPIVYKDDVPQLVPLNEFPTLPQVSSYKPTGTGEGPLAALTDWVNLPDGSVRETDTMPGYAGSSWYFLRYMDPHNSQQFVSEKAVEYWKEVDIYIGGAEHATGHLLYVRFWTKFLFDLGLIPSDEPAKKLINQGMIQGVSFFVRAANCFDKEPHITEPSQNHSVLYLIPDHFPKLENETLIRVPISHVTEGKYLTLENFRLLKGVFPAFEGLEVLTEEIYHKIKNIGNQFGYLKFDESFRWNTEQFSLKTEVEKMSKSKHNVVNPDDIVAEYGADTLRLYEMFLGPIEQSKPWNTNGISGVHNFLKKTWRLYQQASAVNFGQGTEPSKEELRILYKTIKKVRDDMERFSFNTSVSNFMICINELTDAKCVQRQVLEPFAVLISPYAPHMAEEIWKLLGHQPSIAFQPFPTLNETYLQESVFNYPISFNGKHRFNMQFSTESTPAEIQDAVLKAAETEKWLEGKAPKKVIVVPKKIVNIVF